MERKIGEIFEYDGEWYQCLPEIQICVGCAFRNNTCKGIKGIRGECQSASRQTDGVIFKKLEKVGEPYEYFVQHKGIVMLQPYKLFTTPIINGVVCNVNYDTNTIDIELKQTKEDVEEKKLIELLSEKVHNAWMKEKEAQGFSCGKDYDKEKKKHPDMLPYNELKEEVKEYDRATVRAVLQAQKELQSKYNYNNLKSFDLEAAKQGKPVCTRDGHKARIICFDRKDIKSIVALVTFIHGTSVTEKAFYYFEDGCHLSKNDNNIYDLMMLPEKHEGWVNICKDVKDDDRVVLGRIFESREDAVESAPNNDRYITIATVRIEWEE